MTLGTWCAWLLCLGVAFAAENPVALAPSATLAAPAAPATPVTPPTPPAPSAPPAVPDTDIFLSRIGSGGTEPFRNLTARPGYDNQPAFLADGSAILFVARDDSGSTDVWRADIETGALTQVTHTPEAEYSPTPLADGSGFSAVRVEAPHAEGEIFTESQRLFKYGFDGVAIGPVLANVRRVGYHAWIDAAHVALFIVGNEADSIPNSLVLASVPDGEITPLARDIGRSLGRAPDGRVTFVDQSQDAWWITTIAPGGSVTQLLQVPQGPAEEKLTDRSQDFCWLPDGSLLMANGSRLLRARVDSSRPGWKTSTTFTDLGGRIRRLAVSRDGQRVAFVVEMPPREAPAQR